MNAAVNPAAVSPAEVDELEAKLQAMMAQADAPAPPSAPAADPVIAAAVLQAAPADAEILPVEAPVVASAVVASAATENAPSDAGTAPAGVPEAPVALVDDAGVVTIAGFLRKVIDASVAAKKVAEPKLHRLVTDDAAAWPAGDLPAFGAAMKQHGAIDLPITAESAESYRPAFIAAQAMVRADIAGPAKPAKAAKEPKAPKTPKELKAPKDAAPPPAEAEITVAPCFATPAAQVTLSEDRTKKVPAPEVYFLEGRVEDHPKRRGHQVDPSRPASCVAVMPNAALFAQSGNPYPAVADDTIVTEDKWVPYVILAHHVFNELTVRKEVKGRQKEVVESALKAAGLKPDTKYAEMAVSDALRDLALYGYCRQFLQGRSRIFRLEANQAHTPA